MKKILSLMMALCFFLSLAGCTQAPATAPEKPVATAAQETATAAPAATESPKTFEPASQGEWIITYNPGSGADLFSRAVVAAFTDGNVTKASLPIISKSEGSGMVGIQYVATISDQGAADNTLITLGGGDVTEAISLGSAKEGQIIPLAVMASELPMLVKGKECKFADFNDAIAQMKAGKQVIMGGPQNDYVIMAEKLRAVLGVTEKELTYVPFASGKEGLTNLMGNHIDFAFCTPAHAGDLVASGDVIPQWIYHTEHYQYGALVDLPTLKEYTNGAYENLSNPIYRMVCAGMNMSPEAQQYWIDCLDAASKTDSWKKYCETYSLSSIFLTGEDAKSIM